MSASPIIADVNRAPATNQLDISAASDVPHLLVEWSSPWQEFLSAVGPALRRSPPALRAEARVGLFPLRGIAVTWLLEVAALAATIALPISEVRPIENSTRPVTHEVIYFSPDELPRTPDLGGAPSGELGKSGGSLVRHGVQTIKAAREETVREKIIDAPKLRLPNSDSQIANLLAYRTEAGRAPAEALSSNRSVSQLISVAPPPAEIQERRWRQAQLANPSVVPPPIELPREQVSSRRTLATSVVVPPPVLAPESATSKPARLTLPTETVVAPRPELRGVVRSAETTGRFQSQVAPPLAELSTLRSAERSFNPGQQAVVPPAAEMQNLERHAVESLGSAAVVPPPAELASTRSRPTLEIPNVAVAPPPTSAGAGKSAAADDGKQTASTATAVIVSPQAGSKPGAPPDSQRASLALSPAGSSALGSGGTGGGAGTSRGTSSGNSISGAGSGAASAGARKGTNSGMRAGDSSSAGPGGAGNMASGSPRVPGVSVSGGSNVVHLPSFGATPDPRAANRSHLKNSNKNEITVVAGPRSGGAMNFYGLLKGDRVYTIYISTAVGTAVMQFADPTSAAHPYANDLSAPLPIRSELPSNLGSSRLVISCVVDRSGTVRSPYILQSEDDAFEQDVMAALPNWKFTPALRGNDAVEVNAILGFGVDTK